MFIRVWPTVFKVFSCVTGSCSAISVCCIQCRIPVQFGHCICFIFNIQYTSYEVSSARNSNFFLKKSMQQIKTQTSNVTLMMDPKVGCPLSNVRTSNSSSVESHPFGLKMEENHFSCCNFRASFIDVMWQIIILKTKLQN